MATWNDNGNMCAACFKIQVGLAKYICPQCGREGCPDCMPAGEAESCPYCVEAVQREANQHRAGGGSL